MTDLRIMLAQAEDGGVPFKVIVGVLFFLFWLGVQIVSAWMERQKKRAPRLPDADSVPAPSPRQEKQEAPQRVPRREQRPPPMRQGPPPMPERVARQRRETKQQQQQRRRAVEALEELARASTPHPSPPPRRPSAPERPAAVDVPTYGKQNVSGPTQGQRIRALVRPKNLRKEFILTELLQKPISIRGEI